MNENPSKSYFSFRSRFRKQNIFFLCVSVLEEILSILAYIPIFILYETVTSDKRRKKNGFKDAFGSKWESMKTDWCLKIRYSESFISLD